MSDQHEQYEPYGQQPGPQQWTAGGYDEGPQTQVWQGRTWETGAQPQAPGAAEDTAYLPPQNAQSAPAPQHYGPNPGPLPAEVPAPHQPYAQDAARHAAYPQQGTDPYAGRYTAAPEAGQYATPETNQYAAASGTGPHATPEAAQYPSPQATTPYDDRAADAYAYSAAPQQTFPPASAGPGSAGPGPSDPASAEPAPAGPAPTGGPSYGPATTVGNTRITDAQRARAEGRSPIIAPGIQPAGITAGIGVLLAVGAALNDYALLVPLLVLQGLSAAGWFRLNGMWPARQGIALAFAGALAADVVLLAVGREHAPAALIGTLGVWVLLTLVLQLRSHASPDERMYGLMATVAAAALAILAGGFLGASTDAVVVGALAVAAASLARALPLPETGSVVVSLLTAAGAGIAAGGLTGLGSGGALLGLGAGVSALIGLRVAGYDYPSRFVHMTAGVALPLAASAPLVYLLGRAVV
ncbi:hypothetical protein [Streptomyces sp. KLOTTS4A1]|uniref:hypothetical protein n=1 Tax=Streptomyces sp. KLOTTS4A1 TaxID=3390996 RepID=UPI0039F62A73